jgi:hypothetical protein
MFLRFTYWRCHSLPLLYNNQRISLINDLINMNIEINIETPLFENDTYSDQTNSNIFEKVRFFLLNRQNDVVLKVSSFSVLLYFVFFWFFSPFPLFALIHDSFVYPLFLKLCCICFAVIIYYVYIIIHVRRGLNISYNNLCPRT